MDRKRTRLSPAARRQQLLETGVTILSSHRPEALTPHEVAERALVSRALVFHYFPTTDVLRTACASSIIDTWIAQMGAAAAEGAEPLVAQLIDSFVGFVAESPQRFEALLALSAWDTDLELYCDQARQVLIDAALEGVPVERRPVAALIVRGWEAMMEQTALAWAKNPEMTREQFVDLLVVMLRNTIAVPEQLAVNA